MSMARYAKMKKQLFTSSDFLQNFPHTAAACASDLRHLIRPRRALPPLHVPGRAPPHADERATDARLDQERCGSARVPHLQPLAHGFTQDVVRLEPEPALSSDADEQLLIKIQFNVPVSVRKIMVVGADKPGCHPNAMRCYVGRAAEDLDFEGIDGALPAQVAELALNPTGEGYVNTVRMPFTNITALTLFFPSNHGDEEETKITYIGLQGDHTHGQRMAVDAKYELIATPNDDKLFQHSHDHHLAPNAGGKPAPP